MTAEVIGSKGNMLTISDLRHDAKAEALEQEISRLRARIKELEDRRYVLNVTRSMPSIVAETYVGGKATEDLMVGLVRGLMERPELVTVKRVRDENTDVTTVSAILTVYMPEKPKGGSS